MLKKLLIAALLLGGLWSGVVAQDKVVKLKIVETSDVHGNFYPYDFIRRQPASGSLARVQAFVRQERQRYGDNLILLDNGDILQGQPSAYYYNYMDTVSPHLTAEMQNYMDYDAGTVGNHDIETGRAVFDRWAADCRFPVLGANVIDRSTGRPHFKPYVMLEREGVRIGHSDVALRESLARTFFRGHGGNGSPMDARHPGAGKARPDHRPLPCG